MNRLKIDDCPVCKSKQSECYISTNALMHKVNQEEYRFKKCMDCESVFLENPVPENVLDDYYTDNYLPYKGDEAWGKFKSFVAKSQEQLDTRRMKIVANCIKNKKSFTILDVGCGNPSFLVKVQKELNAECTGIDFSDNGWKDKSYENLTLIKTTISDFNPNMKFDIITLWHYLEHDYHLEETVEKLQNFLNTDGQLIIEVPNYKSITAQFQKQFWQGWHSPRHLTLFSKNGFLRLFNQDKWTLVKYCQYGTLDAFTLWWLGKMEKKKCHWAGSMEQEFWPLVFLKIVTFPFFLFEKVFPMGIQLIIFKKNTFHS
ncbi:MAG: class I SAM-dependent methyltransferase [Bacteroidota bacterium]|nr:class I SAM-dependent methyltransferase [Bacteroidota bacterium]